jgi:hypothetical protein
MPLVHVTCPAHETPQVVLSNCVHVLAMVLCLYCWSNAVSLSCIVFAAIDKTEKACKMWVVIKTSNTVRVVQVCLVHCSAHGTGVCSYTKHQVSISEPW